MSKQNDDQNKPQPQSKITKDIFTPPIMSNETRGDQQSSVKMQNVNDSLLMRQISYSEDVFDPKNK